MKTLFAVLFVSAFLAGCVAVPVYHLPGTLVVYGQTPPPVVYVPVPVYHGPAPSFYFQWGGHGRYGGRYHGPWGPYR